jgi:hypothetical protein
MTFILFIYNVLMRSLKKISVVWKLTWDKIRLIFNNTDTCVLCLMKGLINYTRESNSIWYSHLTYLPHTIRFRPLIKRTYCVSSIYCDSWVNISTTTNFSFTLVS